MQWVASEAPSVQKQRGKWVLRHVGYDPTTGRRKVRQLGTFATKKAALERARAVGAGLVATAEETVATYVADVWLRAPRRDGSSSRPSTSTAGRSTTTSSR